MLESGARRVFASALDWPGWCRSGRSEEDALEALAAYFPRYAPVAEAAGFPFPAAAADFEVIERLKGSATTDFGAPEAAALAEGRPVDLLGARRISALVSACWPYFDAVAAAAPRALRKGPRGGGRDTDRIVGHLEDAEVAYARKVGIRDRAVVGSPTSRRDAIAELLARPSDGAPLAERGWSARYAARRIAWHVLDHAWEIEDRSQAP